jgi:hypothetical protein
MTASTGGQKLASDSDSQNGDGDISDSEVALSSIAVAGIVRSAVDSASSKYETVSVKAGKGGTVGAGYRRGTLTIEYQTPASLRQALSEAAGATGLVELDSYTPVSTLNEPYPTVRDRILDGIVQGFTEIPSVEALDPITVWPKQQKAGLYRVGVDMESREVLYACAFRIPPSMETANIE